MDKVVLYGMAEDLSVITRPTLGRGKALSVLTQLEAAPTFGVDTDLTGAVRRLCQWHKKRGLVIAVSDFFMPRDFEEGLKLLQWHHHDVFCIQVQDTEDQRCPIKGDVELQCVESGRVRKMTITQAEARAYEQAVRDWNERLRSFCASRGIGLVATTPQVPFDTVIQNILRRGGLVS
jgi:hypothetical protein